MGNYIIKRLLLMIPTLLIVALAIFMLMSLTEIDPGRLLLGDAASQEDVDAKNSEFGLDKPAPVQFFNYVKNIVLNGDFGNSWFTRKTVADELFARIPTSLKLATLGMLVTLVVGVPLGILSAVKQYSFLDTFSRISAMIIAALPSFWLGLLLLLLFALKLGWLPTSGDKSFLNFIMPMIALGLPHAASMLRLTRSSMLETIRADYIRTAMAKGVPKGKVILSHALRNALLPIITQTGLQFGAMVGGSVVTEKVFAMPGLGTKLVDSVKQCDVPLVVGTCLIISITYSFVMLAVDLLYAYVDPRIKAKYSK